MKNNCLIALVITLFTANIAFAADEIHWTITGQDSVTFDWRGTAQENSIGYGLSSGDYTQIMAQPPNPAPSSSQGPFWEAKLTGLKEDTLYYYAVGNGPERTFRTAPPRGSSDFTIYAQGNIGETTNYFNMGIVQDLIANGQPAFVIGLGDLSLGSVNGAAAVDQHFNDVMAWSKEAAYMPVWGDLDWRLSSTDGFNNYKGRFDVPNSQTSPGSPLAGGKDWYWFDYGNTRFITLPEPWTGAWPAWNTKADDLMAQAQVDPGIQFIVTFVHQPAYSSGHYPGSITLKAMLDALGDKYSKYVLNVNAHSVNYERSYPQHGVVHVTAGTGGTDLQQDGVCLWSTCAKPSWSAYRAMRQGALKLYFTNAGIEGSFICGPAGGGINDISCTTGSVMDTFMITASARNSAMSPLIGTASTSAAATTPSLMIGAATTSAATTTTSTVISAAATTSTNLVGNPGFESGASIWSASSGIITSSTSQPAHSGSWKAWLNGYGTAHTDNLNQAITIPSTATSTSLSFWLHIDTAETTASNAYDKLSVQVQNSSGTLLKTLATYSNLNKNTGYAQKSFDLSAYKGQTIRIAFTGTEDASLKTSFVLDDFLFGTDTATSVPASSGGSSTFSGEAFPGAQGGGAASKGGRGGVIIEVTNLNNSGTGSLRACVEAVGPRTCVFRVAGTIQLTSVLNVTNPYLTVAGQTAPGGGILLSGKNAAINMVNIRTHNVIWRYTRIRKGYTSTCTGECGGTVNLYGHDVIFDHNSTSWNQDEGIGSWGWVPTTDPRNLTISSNLVAEGLKGHSTAFITGGENAVSQINIDYHHNLVMNNSHRNPLLKNKSSRIVNNIFYNQAKYVNQLLGGIQADIIGNLYKKGPLNNTWTGTSWAFHEVEIAPTSGSDSPVSGSPSIYLSGNKGWYQTSPSGNQWLMTAPISSENNIELSSGSAPTAYQRTARMANTTFPIIAEPVANLETSLPPVVGASRRLACDGTWVSNRDSVDTRLVRQFQTNTGISAIAVTEADVGGFPTIASGTACTDTDHDGMPDVWETARGLNPNNSADRNAIAGNGYTNVENYLNGQ